MTARRVTRRNAFRGQQLTVTTRSGETLTGTLLGWGASLLRLQTEAGWRELAVASLDSVTSEN